MEDPSDDSKQPDLEEYLRTLLASAEDDAARQHLLRALYVEGCDGRTVRMDWNIALAYRSGEGVPKDEEKAREWTLIAAENRHPEAQYEMGRMCLTGDGLPQDHAEAARWFHLAAEQGDPWAQCNLGTLYADGSGVPKDWGEALKCWHLAAEQGHLVSQFNLGQWYSDAQEFETAAQFYRQAAAQGHERAAQNLALLYQAGVASPPQTGP